jgi:hypothetical protein
MVAGQFLQDLEPGRSRLLWFSVCLAGLVLCALLLPHHPDWVGWPWRLSGPQDATAFRAGAELVGTPLLYDPGAIAARQQRNAGTSEQLRMFLGPPWYAAATGWLAWMPYRQAVAIWKVLLLAGGALLVLAWPGNRLHAALAVCWSLPLAAGIEQGQDSIWVAAALAFALRLLPERPWAAGLVLSLCSIKFHFLLFVPIFIVARRQWRLAAGLAAGILAQLAGSTAVQGWGWWDGYARAITSGIDGLWWMMPSFGGLLRIFPGFPASAVVVAAAMALILWRAMAMESGRLALSACIAGALLVAPHAYVQDAVVLIPFCLELIPSRPSLRGWAVFLLSPLATWPSAAWIPVLAPACVVAPATLILLSLSSSPTRRRLAPR